MHEALVAYLYDEATAEERVLLNAHLTDCASCAQELQAFERVRTMLQQWQIDDLPVVRVVSEKPTKRSLLTTLKELISVTPIWAKALGAVAMAERDSLLSACRSRDPRADPLAAARSPEPSM